MRKTIGLIALLAGLIISAPQAQAQPAEGDQEVTLAGNYFKQTGGGDGGATVDGSYGYFFVPAIEAGLRQSYTLNQRNNATDTWLMTTVGFADWHFVDNPIGHKADWDFVPYLGGFIGAVWNDKDGTGLLGPEAGVKLYLSDSAFLNGAYRYEWFWDNVDISERSAASNHVVTVGLGYSWGGAGKHDHDHDRARYHDTTYSGDVVR